MDAFFIYTVIPFALFPLHLLSKFQFMRKLFLLLFLLPLMAVAQKKQITLEDIYKKGTFRGEFVPAVFDTTQKEPELKLDEVKDETGKSFGRADDQVENPVNKNFWLLKKGSEQIYRRSSKSFV